MKVQISAFLPEKSGFKKVRISRGYLAPLASALMGLRVLSYPALL
jgi:hypothetical protein